MENFFRAKFEDYNLGRASQKALRTVPCIRSHGTVIQVFEIEGYILNDVLLTVYTIQSKSHQSILTRFNFKSILRSCLIDARRILFFTDIFADRGVFVDT